jgi:hypothetical protein
MFSAEVFLQAVTEFAMFGGYLVIVAPCYPEALILHESICQWKYKHAFH